MAGTERPHGAREGRGRLTDVAELWGDSDYEAIVPHYSSIYDELVARLAPRPGERWLDLACGTGEVALRAARAGAAVYALDIAPRMVERASAKADEEGLDIAFSVGDCMHLPYSDDSFDVVASNFGLVFASDAPQVASEVKRVCRDRAGFTAWHELPELSALYARFGRERVGGDPTVWADRPAELLGDVFDLEVHERTWHLHGASGEDVLAFWERTAAPTKAYLASLDDTTRTQVRAALVEHWEGYRTEKGVDEPRPYALVIGLRR